MKNTNLTRAAASLLACGMVFGLTACSSSASSSEATAESAASSEAAGESTVPDDATAESAADDYSYLADFSFSDAYDENGYLFMVTRSGTVKRTEKSAFRNIRTVGLRVLTLEEGDELMAVLETDGQDNILIATHEGKAICFDENEVRAMGRVATGVRGIKLAEGDYVIGAARARKDAYVLSITENGYGKRTPVEEFTVHHRGGGGMMLHNLTEKTGLVAGIAVVDSENDVMIITDDGVIIRTGVEEIRGSQGVIVMRTGEDVKVISIARTDKEEEDPAEAEEETSESAENAESTEE